MSGDNQPPGENGDRKGMSLWEQMIEAARETDEGHTERNEEGRQQYRRTITNPGTIMMIQPIESVVEQDEGIQERFNHFDESFELDPSDDSGGRNPDVVQSVEVCNELEAVTAAVIDNDGNEDDEIPLGENENDDVAVRENEEVSLRQSDEENKGCGERSETNEESHCSIDHNDQLNHTKLGQENNHVQYCVIAGGLDNAHCTNEAAVQNADDDLAVQIKLRLQQLAGANTLGIPGGIFDCQFSDVGCLEMFLTRRARNRHVAVCFYGVFRSCRNEECIQVPDDYATVYGLLQHISSHRSCRISNIDANGNIQFDYNFTRDLFILNYERYKMDFIQRIEFCQEDHLFKLVLALITRDIEMAEPLVMLVAMLYSEDVEVDDLVDLQIQVKGRDGQVVRPVLAAVCDEGKIVTTAFRSPKHFLRAIDQPGGVLVFSHADIISAAFEDKTLPGGQLSIQVDLSGFRCSIKRDKGLMENQVVSNWEDIDFDQDVKELVLKDGRKAKPFKITRIMIPQMKWIVDSLFECVDIESGMSRVIAALFDDVLKTREHLGEIPATFPRLARAIILFPTISSSRKFQRKWQEIATQMGINLYAFESLGKEIIDHLERYGCDIVLMTPGQWFMANTKATGVVVPIIHSNLKHIVVFQPDRVTYPVALQNMNFCVTQIGEQQRETIIRVGIGEEISVDTAEKLRLGLFTDGFNLFSLGQDATHLLRRMLPPRNFPITNKAEAISRIINEDPRQVSTRYLVIAVKNEQREGDAHLNLARTLVASVGQQRVTTTTRERDVLNNSNFFNSFLTTDNSILLAPFFILDYDEIGFCTHIILWTLPSQEEKIRIGKLVYGTNKVVITL